MVFGIGVVIFESLFRLDWRHLSYCIVCLPYETAFRRLIALRV